MQDIDKNEKYKDLIVADITTMSSMMSQALQGCAKKIIKEDKNLYLASLSFSLSVSFFCTVLRAAIDNQNQDNARIIESVNECLKVYNTGLTLLNME